MDTKQGKAVELLATGMKHKDVAASVGVTPQTISNWYHDPEFEAAVNRLRKESWDGTRAQILGLFSRAVTTLDGLLQDPSPSVRLDAVREARALVPESDRALPAIGPTDAARVRKERDRSERRQQGDDEDMELFLPKRGR